MKVISKLFVFALILSLIFSISLVAAQENMTFDQSELKTVSIETNNEYQVNQEIDNENLESNNEVAPALADFATVASEDTDFSQIQDKIDRADSGDTIFLDGKTYTGSSPINVEKRLTIVGGSSDNDDSYATLDAGGITRIINLYADNIVIRHVRFINGSSDTGGAIWGQIRVSFELRDCIFEGNTAEFGGAVFVNGPGCNIVNCNFTNNYASNQGGAIIMRGSSQQSSVTNCNFIANNARSWGGAIKADSNGIIISNSNFINNWVNLYSGGAINFDGRDIAVLNSRFINNSAGESGGALRFSNSNHRIINSIFINNTASTDGGAVMFYYGDAIVSQSNFTDNSAKTGIAVYAGGDNLQILNNRFTNTKDVSGDYVWINGENTTISNNYIDNSRFNSSGLYIKNSANDVILDNTYPNPLYVIIDVSDTFIGRIGETIQIPVYVTDNFKNPLSGNVSIEDYQSMQLSNGKAVFNMLLPLTHGILYFNVSYFNHTRTSEVTVREFTPTLTITQNENTDDIHVKLSSNVTGSIIVNINSVNYLSNIVNGEATVKITGLTNGIYPAIVAYSGDDDYLSNGEIFVVMIKNNPLYKISQNKDISLPYTGKTTYRVLISKDGNPVGAGEEVTVSFNGKNTVVKTDAGGYAAFDLNANVKPGTYNIKTTYRGVSAVNKVKVSQIIKTSDKKVKKSAKVSKVKISLAKVNGKYVNGAKLTVKFNGKKYTVKTNKKGVATWNIKKSMIKKLKVGKKVKYTVNYGKDSLTKNIIVKK